MDPKNRYKSSSGPKRMSEKPFEMVLGPIWSKIVF